MGGLLSEPVAAKAFERGYGEDLVAGTCTVQGYRRTHEDAHVMVCRSSQSAGRYGVFAVLDGHGGREAANLGSKLLQEELCKFAAKGTVSKTEAEAELKKAFITVDDKLRQQLPPEDSSGSTVVAAVVLCQGSEYCVHLAHAGDSRAVFRRADGTLISTDDHKPGREDETRRIQKAGGTVEPGPLGGGPLRVDGALAVSRSLGDFRFKSTDILPEQCKVTAVPEVMTITNCKAGDWLMLACDGIFDVMESSDVNDFVQERLSKSPPYKADGATISGDLITHCIDKGSKDNCTACLVQLLPPGSGTAADTKRELIEGPWSSASGDVQSKYIEFFEAEGFSAQAETAREAIRTHGGGPDRNMLGVGGDNKKTAQFMLLAKALQAIKAGKSAGDSAPTTTSGALGSGGRGAGRGSDSSSPGGGPMGHRSSNPGL
mmetsp:Transcript_24007/g.52249  ORF Transcript_24007/g.52249 Transcript_24007/m.52249 type:complete len:431 (+) Transcript_24007:26-1318(+)